MPITTRTVTGTLYGPGNTPVGGGTVRFVLSGPDVEGTTIILPRPVDVTVGSDGTFSTSLWVNSAGSSGSTGYRVSGFSRTEFRIVLTPGTSIDIIGLINSAPVLTIDTTTGQAHVTASTVSPVTSYVLEMSTDSGGNWSVVQTTISPSTINYTTDGTVAGVISFRAKSVYNGVSSAWSAVVSGPVLFGTNRIAEYRFNEGSGQVVLNHAV